MPLILGLAGQARSGKTTASSYIKSIVSIPVYEHSFAKRLKEFCIYTLGLRLEQCDGTDEDKNSPTFFKWEDIIVDFRRKYSHDYKLKCGQLTAREVMQVQGEMQRTHFCPDIWIRPVFREIHDCQSTSLHIISDIRHLNEVEECCRNGAKILFFAKKTNNDKAASEIEITKVDWKKYGAFIIDNTFMTIDEKNIQIRNILSNIPEFRPFLKPKTECS